MNVRHFFLVLVAGAALAGAGCSGSGTTLDMKAQDLSATCAKPGGPVTGAADNHCSSDGGMIIQPTSQAICNVLPDMAGSPQDGGTDTGSDYGATMYLTSGYDDDCKYHVTYSVSPVCDNMNVWFVMTATNTTDGKPTTGANTIIEAYLSDTHPAPNAPTTTVEGPPGTYTIGPVLFDASGQWTVRFHLFETCFDYLDNSPHGHAAFYLNVP